MKRMILGGLFLALAGGVGSAATAQGGVDLSFQGRPTTPQGGQGPVPVDDWRSRMNVTHADNMARLRAQAAAGQAAHRARQDSYASMNQAWADRQAAGERETGRFIDMINERTTVQAGGVRTDVPYGSAAFTDGYGAVILLPEDQEGPAGWRKMTPLYGAPD